MSMTFIEFKILMTFVNFYVKFIIIKLHKFSSTYLQNFCRLLFSTIETNIIITFIFESLINKTISLIILKIHIHTHIYFTPILL